MAKKPQKEKKPKEEKEGKEGKETKEGKEEKGGDKKKEAKKETATTGNNMLRDRLFGVHIQTYMDILSKHKDKNKFPKQFKKWDECLKANKLTKVEDLYKKIFAEIRKNPIQPAGKKKEQKKITREKDTAIVINGKHKYRRDQPLNNKQRRQRVDDKISKFIAKKKTG